MKTTSSEHVVYIIVLNVKKKPIRVHNSQQQHVMILQFSCTKLVFNKIDARISFSDKDLPMVGKLLIQKRRVSVLRIFCI